MIDDTTGADSGELDFSFEGETGDSNTPETGEQPKPYEVPDDAYVSVKVDGQDKLLPWKEARNGIQFQSAFTKKTQDLATQRQAYERDQAALATQRQQFEGQQSQLREFFANPQNVMAYYMHLMAKTQGEQAPNTPQPVTSDALPKFRQELEQSFDQRLRARDEEFARARSQEKLESELETHMNGLLAKAPLLGSVDGVADVIFKRVFDLKPTSMDEAKQSAQMIVEQMQAKAEKVYVERQKQAAITKAAALRNGVEPRGGQGVYPVKKDPRNLADLDNDFLAFLQAQDRAGA